MKKGINNLSTHEVKRAPPISPEDIKLIVNFLATAGPPGEVLSAAILLGYFSLTRQSNYTSPGLDVWGGAHTIRRKDVVATEEGLCLTIRSTKTIKKQEDAVPILIPWIPGSRYCPVRAWYRNIALVRLGPNDPAFVAPNGRVITPYILTMALRMGLEGSRHLDTSMLTLHGMRRGAAQAAVRAGATLKSVMDLGTWLSSSVYSYVPREMITAAPLALGKMFGGRARGDRHSHEV